MKLLIACAVVVTFFGSYTLGAAAPGTNPQTMWALHPSQIQNGISNDGTQGPGAFPGQTKSQTSQNNFINFCMTRGELSLTNGQQIAAGSCNPTPMGVLVGQNRMPASKFIYPKNLDRVPANQDLLIQMKIQNLKTGTFVNADTNFFGAPQNTDVNGTIIGHTHFVIERIGSLQSTTLSDPTEFAFFKGVNSPANNGVLTDIVKGGLPAGTYKLSSMNAAANHQPALVSVSQHGPIDDIVYFTSAPDVINENSDTN